MKLLEEYEEKKYEIADNNNYYVYNTKYPVSLRSYLSFNAHQIRQVDASKQGNKPTDYRNLITLL